MNKNLIFLTITLVTICDGVYAQVDDGLDELMATYYAAKLHQDSIDVSNMVAVYDYECKTKDADEQDVTDRMRVCVQVGQHCTRSYPHRKFREDNEDYDYFTPDELPMLRAESYCFMPEVWTNYPDGQVTVRDAIIPNIFETRKAREAINWTLSDDTLTVSGYLCKKATCQLHGRKWTVHYAEDIPTSAGPWKLSGLPGLILDAEADGGIHHFTIYSISHTVTPIFYEHNAITTKIAEEKLIKNRIKIFGNKLYPKNPTYYIPDRRNMQADEVFVEIGNDFLPIVNGVLMDNKAHVYQPLELKK